MSTLDQPLRQKKPTGKNLKATVFPRKNVSKEAFAKFFDDDDEEPLFQKNMVQESSILQTIGKRQRPINNEYNIKGEEDDSPSRIESAPPITHKKLQTKRIRRDEYDTKTGVSVLLSAHDGLNVDVVAVIYNTGSVKTTNTSFSYRNITLCDPSMQKIVFTLWGERAKTCRLKVGDAVKIENATVKTFGGMPQLSSKKATRVRQLENSNQCGKHLREWWIENRDARFRQVYREDSVKIEPLNLVHERVSGDLQGTDYFFVKAHLMVSMDAVTYQACLVCGKKVVKPDGSDDWFCVKCQGDVVETCDKYLVRLEVRDGSSVVEMTAFDSVGKVLFEKSAEELSKLDPENKNDTSYDDAIDSIQRFVYVLKCSVKRVKFKDDWKTEFEICDVLGKEEIPGGEYEAQDERVGSSDETMLDEGNEEV